jgi:hypothetical protein
MAIALCSRGSGCCSNEEWLCRRPVGNFPEGFSRRPPYGPSVRKMGFAWSPPGWLVLSTTRNGAAAWNPAAFASRGPRTSGTRIMRVVVNWPLEFVLVTTDPVETDHEIRTSLSRGKPRPVTVTRVPGGPSEGFSRNDGRFEAGGWTTVVVVARVLVVRVLGGPVLVVGAVVVGPFGAVVPVVPVPAAVVPVAVVAVVPVAVVPVRFVPVPADVAVLVVVVPLVPGVVLVFPPVGVGPVVVVLAVVGVVAVCVVGVCPVVGVVAVCLVVGVVGVVDVVPLVGVVTVVTVVAVVPVVEVEGTVSFWRRHGWEFQ